MKPRDPISDPGSAAARARVAALFEHATRVSLSVVVVAPPDETRESARDVATDAAIVAGRSALLREATAAARENVLTGFANAGFSGTWAVSDMSMSVATAADRVAAVEAFEEATVAAVAEDLVDPETLDILGATWDQIASSSGIPSPGALSSIAATAAGVDRSPIQVAILAGVVLVCAFAGFTFGSYAGLILVFLGVGLVGALMRGFSRSAR